MNVRMSVVPIASAGLLVLNGCATTSTSSEEEASQAKEYRTGSNLPSRDASRVRTVSGADMETMKTLPPTGPIRAP